MPAQLLATIADLLAEANWQRQGDNKAQRPQPIQRPGVDAPNKAIGGTARPVEEVRAVLDAWRRGEGVTDGS
jgi:hypothetical protein